MTTFGYMNVVKLLIIKITVKSFGILLKISVISKQPKLTQVDF